MRNTADSRWQIKLWQNGNTDDTMNGRPVMADGGWYMREQFIHPMQKFDDIFGPYRPCQNVSLLFTMMRSGMVVHTIEADPDNGSVIL